MFIERKTTTKTTTTTTTKGAALTMDGENNPKFRASIH